MPQWKGSLPVLQHQFITPHTTVRNGFVNIKCNILDLQSSATCFVISPSSTLNVKTFKWLWGTIPSTWITPAPREYNNWYWVLSLQDNQQPWRIISSRYRFLKHNTSTASLPLQGNEFPVRSLHFYLKYGFYLSGKCSTHFWCPLER